MSDFDTLLSDSFHGETCLLLVLSKKRRDADSPLDKLSVRPVRVGRENRFQFTLHSGSRETHENLTASEAIERIRRMFGPVFEHCHLYTTLADFSVRSKSCGSVKIKRKPPSKQPSADPHNRAKNYLIPPNVPCPFLAEIGVMTDSGKVKASRYAKFRQINRFLELVNEVLDNLPAEGLLNVVDFGCGKSYLTFALHHLLTVIRRREVHIVGLDRNAEVIHDCSRIADKLGCDHLTFQVSDIAEFQPEGQVHLSVSLHACDTATDDALAKAVGWETDVILAVPCCQHELAGTIDSPQLSPLQQHGILKERFAALATDALRAQALQLCGYRTQVVEFIDMEHTAKNILIRAVRSDTVLKNSDARNRFIRAYREFKQLLGLKQMSLEEALGSDFLRQLESETVRDE
ncbi:MAG: SAM-dependent methyltransferase [Planctomycetes bacterium]|nr:SAM-dependent methyltransferase [Planctomycetota bacterium]